MVCVQRRPKAAEDIAGVWDFIADDNLDAADDWVDQLGAQLRLLAT
jgi:toxin ParE1/3/4